MILLVAGTDESLKGRSNAASGSCANKDTDQERVADDKSQREPIWEMLGIGSLIFRFAH